MKAIYDLSLLYMFVYIYTYIGEYILVTCIYIGFICMFFFTDEGVHFLYIIFIRLNAGEFSF